MQRFQLVEYVEFTLWGAGPVLPLAERRLRSSAVSLRIAAERFVPRTRSGSPAQTAARRGLPANRDTSSVREATSSLR